MSDTFDHFLPWVLVFVLVGLSAWQQTLSRTDQNARFAELRAMHGDVLEEIKPIQQQLMTQGLVIPLEAGTK